jgi:hypothetical protein
MVEMGNDEWVRKSTKVAMKYFMPFALIQVIKKRGVKGWADTALTPYPPEPMRPICV